MSSVSLKGIYKKYAGGVVAVSDFNLEIEDKEFIILVGPSGCGKSTTLRMIAGLEEITQGELSIDGRLVNDVPPKERDIAMVFQNYALYPHMTVFENMSFGLRIRKMPKDEIRRRVDEAAKVLEISHLLDRKPAALSGGQRQRVALGRAIVRNPKVFLLDEPLSNLDAKLRTSMRSELIKLHQKLATTFIYVTHDQTEAMTMGTRIVVMKDGYVQQVAAPQELYENPANLFVATFIGTPTMNTAEGTLTREGSKTYLSFGGAKVLLPEDKGNKENVLTYDGKKVIFGIRPNFIYADEESLAANPERLVDVQVELTELLGAETNLYFSVGDIQFISVVPTGSVHCKMGDTIKLSFDTDKIHLFDPEDEKTITN
ncbi:MAG: sn-glycerol-3-phosphate ABC transporter ATP-binding protein UgpC [Oscillospiraceae bacterium]|jgi:multiple sugar transport system ATP-binding protein|nr:sn-glycerol-3-phosphate ABC transporter ATP-binding protein UgpC [Oscillospiraceae bacterium]